MREFNACASTPLRASPSCALAYQVRSSSAAALTLTVAATAATTAARCDRRRIHQRAKPLSSKIPLNDPPPPEPLPLPSVLTVVLESDATPPGSEIAPLTSLSMSFGPPSSIVSRTHQSPTLSPGRYSAPLGGGQYPGVPGADASALFASSTKVNQARSAGSYFR